MGRPGSSPASPHPAPTPSDGKRRERRSALHSVSAARRVDAKETVSWSVRFPNRLPPPAGRVYRKWLVPTTARDRRPPPITELASAPGGQHSFSAIMQGRLRSYRDGPLNCKSGPGGGIACRSSHNQAAWETVSARPCDRGPAYGGTHRIPTERDTDSDDVVPAVHEHSRNHDALRHVGDPVQREAHRPDHVAPSCVAACGPRRPPDLNRQDSGGSTASATGRAPAVH